MRIFTRCMLFILLSLAALPASAHSVTLTWAASTDAGVSYNVYRLSGACPATGSAGFTKIGSGAVSALTYTDSVAMPGVYCYYVTAVLRSAESVPSNLASAVILPSPPTSLTVSGSN